MLITIHENLAHSSDVVKSGRLFPLALNPLKAENANQLRLNILHNLEFQARGGSSATV